MAEEACCCDVDVGGEEEGTGEGCVKSFFGGACGESRDVVDGDIDIGRDLFEGEVLAVTSLGFWEAGSDEFVERDREPVEEGIIFGEGSGDGWDRDGAEGVNCYGEGSE